MQYLMQSQNEYCEQTVSLILNVINGLDKNDQVRENQLNDFKLYQVEKGNGINYHHR